MVIIAEVAEGLSSNNSGSLSMKRRTLYAAVLFALFAIWVGLKLKFKDFGDENVKFIINVFPWFLLMSFGSYCVTKLGWDMMTFNDYPEEIGVLNDVSA